MKTNPKGENAQAAVTVKGGRTETLYFCKRDGRWYLDLEQTRSRRNEVYGAGDEKITGRVALTPGNGQAWPAGAEVYCGWIARNREGLMESGGAGLSLKDPQSGGGQRNSDVRWKGNGIVTFEHKNLPPGQYLIYARIDDTPPGTREFGKLRNYLNWKWITLKAGDRHIRGLDGPLEVLYITYMPRTSATVADLRSHLSRILRRVEGGEEVVVTRHGEGIAKLVPVHDLEEKLAASGVRPAERRGAVPRIRPAEGRVRRSLTRAVLEDRA